MSLHVSIVSVQCPLRLHFELFKLLNFELMRIKIQLFPSVLLVREQSYWSVGKVADPNNFSVESDQAFHFHADSDPVFHWI